MSARSLNKVTLIGNLTRDPELRYTPTGAAVCTIGLATNRAWTTDSGEKKEETEFHRVVAWNKLAELCSQLLTKGRKIYVEGRLRTTTWNAQDGAQRSSTEIVIEDMILLDSKRPDGAIEAHDMPADTAPEMNAEPKKKVVKEEPAKAETASAATEMVNPDDIPF
jgi:single-strand DNA-binding protein